MTSGNNNITCQELCRRLTDILKKGCIENAVGEAKFIIEHITGTSYPQIILKCRLFAESDIQKAEALCERRISGEPLQYILGDWDFFGMTFKVGKGVLIPRPDTEILAEKAIQSRAGFESTNYVDLCSGSGCVAAAVAKYVKNIKGSAIEKSDEAFAYLKENLSKLAPSIKPCLADALMQTTAENYTELDLITANPPYLTAEDMAALQREVTFEPELALFGGYDGLMFYRELTRVWKNSLKSGGMLIFEVGIGQYKDVMKILEENGFCNISFACDLAGIERVVIGQKS